MDEPTVAPLVLVLVVEENLHATYNSIHDTRLWVKVGLTSKARGPFIGSFNPPQRTPQKVVTEKGFDALIQTYGPRPLHGWPPVRATVSQTNNLAHATSTGACGNSESRAPGLTRRPALGGCVVVGPVARRRSGPRPPAASPAHSRLLRVARAPAAAAARSTLRQVAAGL